MYLKKHLGNFFDCTPLSLSSMDLSGGAGIPYKFIPGVFTKKDVLLRFPNMEVDCFNHASQIGWHYEPYYTWDCFPKIEILTAEKAARKTRLICGAPIELCLMGSYISDSLNAAINANPLSVKSAVGLTMNRGGWDTLASYLGGINANVSENDAKQWDSSMSAAWLLMVYRVRRAMMRLNPVQEKIFWFFFCELVNSWMVTSSGDTVFVNGGNKSGSPNTCHDNTLGHILLIAYCFSRSCKRYSDFEKFRCALFGDDFLSEEVEEIFWWFYREFGVMVDIPVPRPLSSASFLSFRFDDTAYGVMPYHVNSKMLFSSFNHQMKSWKSVREQKLFVLYILNFWHCDSLVYKEMLQKLDVEFDFLSIIAFWSGILEDGGFKISDIKLGYY